MNNLFLLIASPILIFLVSYIFFKLKEWKDVKAVYNVKTGKTLNHPSIFDFIFWLFLGDKTKPLMIQILENGNSSNAPLNFRWIFLTPTVAVNSPDLAQQVLKDIDTYEKVTPILFKEGIDFFGTKQLVLVNGNDWHRQRKVFDPAFIALQNYENIFESKTDLVLKQLMDKGNIVSTNDFTQRLALDILGLSIFGHDFNSLLGGVEKEYKAYELLMSSCNQPRNAIYYLIKEALFPWTRNDHLSDAIKTFDKLCYTAIDLARKKTSKKDVCMCDLMVDAQGDENGLTDQEMRDNMAIFFVAGHETTANALGFALYNLSEYPEIQEALRKEIKEVCGNQVATYEQVKNLEGVNNFIKENMRLFPPVAVLPAKITSKDTVLGDYFIPKGHLVSIQVLALHYSKEVYGDPLTFRPDRWKKEESKKFPLASYMPFSQGKRVCIGNNFSLMEQKIFLAKFLQRMKVSKINQNDHPSIDPSSSLFQGPKNYPLKFEKL